MLAASNIRPDGYHPEITAPEQLLASPGNDGTVRLWDVGTGGTVGVPFTGHDGAVSRVAFSRDGQLLASAGGDGTVRLWIGIEACVDTTCERANRNLSQREWDEFLGSDVPYRRTCPDFPSGTGAPSDAPSTGPVDLLED